MSSTEWVVLLDESGEPIGTADKATVHSAQTPLHLAFSCYVFNSRGEMLVTRRALSKVAWPGVWTNSFCGHPGPSESFEDAIARRAHAELGVKVHTVSNILKDFRYRAVDASGIVEWEVCPVFTAHCDTQPQPNPDEVAEYRWVSPVTVHAAVQSAPWAFSPWMVEQAEQWSFAPSTESVTS